MTNRQDRSGSGSPADVPVAPGALPVLGHTLSLVRDPPAWLSACRKAGPLVEVHLGRCRAYLACAPDLVHEMLTTKMKQFDKGGPLYDRARDVFGAGLVTTKHAPQHGRRRLMQPAFSKEGLAAYSSAMQLESQVLADSWRPQEPVDIVADMHRLTMLVFLRVMLPATRIASHAPLATQIKGLTDGVAVRTVLPWLGALPIPANWRFTRVRAALWEAARQAADRTQPEPGGLLRALSVADAHGRTLSDKELEPQIVNLLVAGTETNAALLAWIFHLLDRTPDVQRQVCDELADVLGGRTAARRSAEAAGHPQRHPGDDAVDAGHLDPHPHDHHGGTAGSGGWCSRPSTPRGCPATRGR